LEGAELVRQCIGSAEEERREHGPDGFPGAEKNCCQGNETTASGHVALKELQISHAQVNTPKPCKETAQEEGQVAHAPDIDPGGGAPQSDGTSAEPPPPDDKTDCEQFVDKLVNAVENRKDHFAARASIGLHLADMAIGYLSIGKQRVTGFLERLTDGGQDNDVYRHVAGGAASVLLDGFGLGSGADSLRQDFNIWRGSRVKEAFASKEGNRAGERVGSIIAARIDGFIKTAEALRNKISAVLCNK